MKPVIDKKNHKGPSVAHRAAVVNELATAVRKQDIERGLLLREIRLGVTQPLHGREPVGSVPPTYHFGDGIDEAGTFNDRLKGAPRPKNGLSAWLRSNQQRSARR